MPVPRYLKDGTVRRHKGRSGRNHSGKIVIRHRGGGHNQTYRIIDFVRAPFMKTTDTPPVIKEKVLQIGYDPCRSARIALVAGNGSNRQKLLIAPDTVQVGDVVTSHRGKPESLALLKPGDAYPLKYLPIGTIVHNVELKPGKGAQLARAAGTSAQLIRKTTDTAVVRLPSKEEKVVNNLCMASVGRVSNIDRKNRVIGKAGRNRWLNRRPKGQTGIDRTHWKKKKV
jgi:large subunit ribosomal protein L2